MLHRHAFYCVLSPSCHRFVIVLARCCHREWVKCLQNLLEGDDIKWHCLLSFTYKLRHAFYHALSSLCHRERSRTTGTSIQSAIPNTLINNLLQKHIIGSGVERLVCQCNTHLLIAVYINKKLFTFSDMSQRFTTIKY